MADVWSSDPVITDNFFVVFACNTSDANDRKAA